MRFVVAMVLLGAVACGGRQAPQHVLAGPTPTGDALAPACGHPGTTVEVPAERRTVRHADCDLTGVTIRHGGRGAGVPNRGMTVAGNFDGVNSSSISVTMAPNGDVTYDTRGEENLVEVDGYLVLTGGPAGTQDTPAEGMLDFSSPDGSNGGDGTRHDGSFTLQLYPGHYRISATTPAFNDGATPCVRELVVGTEPLNGVRIDCHRK